MANKKTTEVWQYRKVYFDINGEPAAYAKIPDSHRVVSVELLARAAGMLGKTMYNAGPEVAEQLRAIIDNKEPHNE